MLEREKQWELGLDRLLSPCHFYTLPALPELSTGLHCTKHTLHTLHQSTPHYTHCTTLHTLHTLYTLLALPYTGCATLHTKHITSNTLYSLHHTTGGVGKETLVNVFLIGSNQTIFSPLCMIRFFLLWHGGFLQNGSGPNQMIFNNFASFDAFCGSVPFSSVLAFV